MKKEEMIRRYKALHETEERFNSDIEDIVHKNSDFLTDVYYESNEDFIEVCECVLDIFFYEKIYTYEQDEVVRDALLYAVGNFIDAVSRETGLFVKMMEVEEVACKKIRQYMDEFSFPVFTEEYAGKKLFEEVMALDDENPYKLKLWYALLYPVYEGIDETKKYQMISDVLVYYDFEYKLPQEREQLSQERYRIKNHIPDFSNVKEGQTWDGAHRYSKFIKDLRLKKYKTDSGSYKAQVKSINRSCKWTDDKENRVITLIEIYPVRLEKEASSRARKYEDYFTTVLLYHLHRCEGTFKCTSGKFWINTYVMPRTYKKIPVGKYIENLHINEKHVDELNGNLKKFHNNVDARLKEILEYNFKYLKQKEIVHIYKQMVIVKGNHHVPIDEVKEIGLSPIEVEEMIAVANDYSFSQISGNFYDEATRQMVRRNPKSFAEVRAIYKNEEQKEIFDEYIQQNYGWNYVYEEYVIILDEKWADKKISPVEYEEAKKALNELIVKAVKKNNTTKYDNLKKKYDEEDARIYAMIEQCEDIDELIKLGVVDADGVIQNKQYVYPESFLEQLDSFIEFEICL